MCTRHAVIEIVSPGSVVPLDLKSLLQNLHQVRKLAKSRLDLFIYVSFYKLALE